MEYRGAPVSRGIMVSARLKISSAGNTITPPPTKTGPILLYKRQNEGITPTRSEGSLSGVISVASGESPQSRGGERQSHSWGERCVEPSKISDDGLLTVADGEVAYSTRAKVMRTARKWYG